MILPYATGHRWVKPVTSDPLNDFGKNTRARLRSTLGKIDANHITHRIESLDTHFLDWFLPLYETRINEKANPHIFDIREKTLGSAKPEKYFSLALYEHGVAVGATIFSLSKTRLTIAYRTYRTTWYNALLAANPSAYTEYLICKHAAEMSKQTIIHGKDRNPYGVNSSIGLAYFKLSAGCIPMKPRTFEVCEIDTDTLTVDALILKYPGDTESHISEAYLVASPEGIQKWEQITKYPEHLNVTILPRTLP